MPPKRTSKKNVAQVEQQVLSLQAQISGRALRVANDPPPVSIRPWYPVTVVFTMAFTTSVAKNWTMDELFGALRKQLNLPTDQVVEVQVKSLKLWAPATWQRLSCSFKTITGIDQERLYSSTDSSTRMNSPRLGYEFPISVSSKVHLSTDPNKAIAVVYPEQRVTTSTSADLGILTHTHIHWRMSVPAPDGSSNRIVELTETLSLINKVDQLLERTSPVLE